MGRRSINTTKSGKYMNPTDQARKEARKLELKKNKKQRQMVRAAVLKGKDPYQILEEMEKIDQMEFNVYQPSPLNEKVLKDKRKKLRDTLERVLNMYYRDDPDKWTDLKKKQNEYEHKRIQLVAFYESVKSAQQVSVDEIPLPQMPEQTSTTSITSQIPLPSERKPEHTIYSIATALKLQALGQQIREPPGCPPGPPPDINSDGEEVEFIREKDENETVDRDGVRGDEEGDVDGSAVAVGSGSSSKPTSVQQKMVAISGQSISDFIKEMESVQQKKKSGNIEEKDDRGKGSDNELPLAPPGTDHPTIFPGPIRLPPAPPPGRPLLPPGPPPGLPPPRLPMRLPPAPPRIIRLPGPPPPPGPPSNLSLPGTPNVVSAAPQLINRQDPSITHGVGGIGGGKQRGATISAKPQIRNLSADVTRFVPSTLRVKRDSEGKKQKQSSTRALVHELKQKEMSSAHMIMSGQHHHHHHHQYHHHHQQQQQHTKDDAYMQFMKEMQGLL